MGELARESSTDLLQLLVVESWEWDRKTHMLLAEQVHLLSGMWEDIQVVQHVLVRTTMAIDQLRVELRSLEESKEEHGVREKRAREEEGSNEEERPRKKGKEKEEEELEEGEWNCVIVRSKADVN